jgi:hypothetical protein
VEEDVLFVVITMLTSALAGALSAVFLPRLLHKFKDITAAKKRNGIFSESHDTRKAELEGLNFEKNLVTQMIDQVHRAIENADIDKLEGDRLLLKYSHDLELYNNKIAEMRPLVEFAEISQLRDGLLSLIQERVSSIDNKLVELSKEITASSGSTSGWMKGEERNSAHKKIIEQAPSSASASNNSSTFVTDWQKNNEPAENREDTELQNKVQEDKTIAHIQNQIRDSLARLEQVNTNMPNISDYTNNIGTVSGLENKINRSDVNKKKHDALANFDNSPVR